MKTMDVAENVIQYEVPQVEVIEVEVEQGFAVSDPAPLQDTPWS